MNKQISVSYPSKNRTQKSNRQKKITIKEKYSVLNAAAKKYTVIFIIHVIYTNKNVHGREKKKKGNKFRFIKTRGPGRAAIVEIITDT